MVCFALCVVCKVRFSVFCTAYNGSSKLTKKSKRPTARKIYEELYQRQEHGPLSGSEYEISCKEMFRNIMFSRLRRALLNSNCS